MFKISILIRTSGYPPKRTYLLYRTNSYMSPGCKRLTKKGKAIPLQAWTGPVASRRVRLPDLKTIGK